MKNLTAIGFYFGAFVALRPAAARESLATLLAWHAAGRLRPHVGHVLPLEEANAGLDLLREPAGRPARSSSGSAPPSYSAARQSATP